MKDKKETKKTKKVREKKQEKKVQNNSKSKKPKFTKKQKEIKKKLKKLKKRKNPQKKAQPERKEKLSVKGRQTKWAPVWAVLRKYGVGKRVHPSAMTKHRRSWRRTKLKIGPRKIRPRHYG